jgi:hypothetical protein
VKDSWRFLIWGLATLAGGLAILHRQLRLVAPISNSQWTDAVIAGVLFTTASIGSFPWKDRWLSRLGFLLLAAAAGYGIPLALAGLSEGRFGSIPIAELLAASAVLGVGLGRSRDSILSPAVLGLLMAVAAFVVLDKSTANGAGLLLRHGSELIGLPALIIGIALSLLLEKSANRPEARIRSIKGERFANFLIRYPSQAIGLAPVLRMPLFDLLSSIAFLFAGLVGAVGTANGHLFAAILCAGALLFLGRNTARGALFAVAPASLGQLLPARPGAVGRRAMATISIAFVLIVFLISLAVGVSSYFSLLLAVGIGPAIVGCGVVWHAVVSDRELALKRSLSALALVGIPLFALGPLVQYDGGYFHPGFMGAYLVSGSSFGLLVGLVGISFVSWWRPHE